MERSRIGESKDTSSWMNGLIVSGQCCSVLFPKLRSSYAQWSDDQTSNVTQCSSINKQVTSYSPQNPNYHFQCIRSVLKIQRQYRFSQALTNQSIRVLDHSIQNRANRQSTECCTTVCPTSQIHGATSLLPTSSFRNLTESLSASSASGETRLFLLRTSPSSCCIVRANMAWRRGDWIRGFSSQDHAPAEFRHNRLPHWSILSQNPNSWHWSAPEHSVNLTRMLLTCPSLRQRSSVHYHF